jgi:hypothetical protein
MEFLTGLTARTIDTVALPDTPPALRNWTQRRQEIRDEARDAIVYAQAKMAMYYDKDHKPVSFDVGNSVYINLQKDIGIPGYKIPNDSVARKLGLRRVGPFKVLKKVGDLAYQVNIPRNWKIHNTISVSHLEPAKEDTYGRITKPPPDIVHDEDGSSHEEWEVEEILRSRWKDIKTNAINNTTSSGRTTDQSTTNGSAPTTSRTPPS